LAASVENCRQLRLAAAAALAAICSGRAPKADKNCDLTKLLYVAAMSMLTVTVADYSGDCAMQDLGSYVETA
jgi:hypothetical protein